MKGRSRTSVCLKRRYIKEPGEPGGHHDQRGPDRGDTEQQRERKLNARLLERTTRSLSMTEVGREIFERAVGILGAVEDAERIAQRLVADPRGTLRLTCGVEFGMIAVGGWISDYLRRYPQVSVESDFTGRLVDIVHEGFDIAIRISDLSDSSLAARKLGDLRYGLFAAPGYIRRRGAAPYQQQLCRA